MQHGDVVRYWFSRGIDSSGDSCVLNYYRIDIPYLFRCDPVPHKGGYRNGWWRTSKRHANYRMYLRECAYHPEYARVKKRDYHDPWWNDDVNAKSRICRSWKRKKIKHQWMKNQKGRKQ